jgi:hypothetical protein
VWLSVYTSWFCFMTSLLMLVKLKCYMETAHVHGLEQASDMVRYLMH